MGIPPIDTHFKAYMDYRTLTDESSLQWQIQANAYTDEQGFRCIEDDYIIAVGTYYSSKCGDRYRITLENGKVFTALIGDIKANHDTNQTNQYCEITGDDGELICGNVIEFIIDTDIMNKDILNDGTVCDLGFEGNIVKLEKFIIDK
jgi:hypothetical protein